MKKSGLHCTIAALMICVVSWVTDGFGQDPSKPQPKTTLAQVREASLDSFTLAVEVDLPVHLFIPGQGRATRVMRVSVGKDVLAIVWKASQLPVPKYYPPDTHGYQGGDYDVDGNLIVPMWSEGASFRDQSVHEEYSEGTGSYVAPDGAAKPLNSGALLSRRRPSDSNTVSLNLLRRVLWALGRPWPDSLGDGMSLELNADGTQRLRTAGSWAPTSGSGVSELLIEPSNGHLVRQASFGAEGEAPRAECRSEGTRRFGDVVLAERGEFTLHPIETLTVRLISFKPELDTDLIAEARKVISRAQTRMVQVFDYRDDPKKPKVRLVPAGDLDKDE